MPNQIRHVARNVLKKSNISTSHVNMRIIELQLKRDDSQTQSLIQT